MNLVFSENGKSDFSLITPQELNEFEFEAVSNFTDIVKKKTNVDFAINKGRKKIFIGQIS